MGPATLLTVLGLLQAAEARSAPRYERLDNGLELVIVEDHRLPLVSVQLWFNVGSGDDLAEYPGLCHVARCALELREDAPLRLQAAGARTKSGTLRDACYFASVLPPELTEFVLDVEAGRLRFAAVTVGVLPQTLAHAVCSDDRPASEPGLIDQRSILATMFPGHPYQHPPEFVARSLETISPAEVESFMKTRMVPANATLVIIGDVSSATVTESVRRKFGTIHGGEPPRRSDPKRLEEQTIQIASQLPSANRITIAWRTPPFGFFENAAVDVLMHRLCNAVDGPLRRELDGRGGYRVDWSHEDWRYAGLLQLTITAHPEGPPIDEDAMIDLVRKSLRDSESAVPPPIEHNRARSLAKMARTARTRSFLNRAIDAARYQVIGGNILLSEYDTARIDRVAIADVQDAARMLLNARTVIKRTGGVSVELVPAATPREPATPESASDALLLLASHTDGLPPLVSPKCPARISRHSITSAVDLMICSVPGFPEVEARTIAKGAKYSKPAGPIVDYATYHGIDLSFLKETSRSGWRGSGPRSMAAQIVELQRELLRSQDLSGVSIIAVGEFDEDEILESVRTAWREFRASNVESAEVATTASRPAVEWNAKPSPNSSLQLADEIARSATGNSEEFLVRECGLWQVGAPTEWPAPLHGRHSQRWSWQLRDDGYVLFATPPAEESAAALRQCMDEVDRLRTGRVSEAAATAALRMARARRLQLLGSASGIADLLQLGVANPWDLHDLLSANDVIEALPGAFERAGRKVTVTGPAGLREELRQMVGGG